MVATTRRLTMATIVRKAESLEPLGWQVRRTRAGVIIKAPDNGGTASLHSSGGSDHRGLDNTLADLARIGFDAALEELASRERDQAQAALTADRAVADTAPVVTDTGTAAAFPSAGTDDFPRPSVLRGLQTRTEPITPDRAKTLSERPMTAVASDGSPLRQRHVKPKHVDWLAGIISRGEWKVLPEGIALAPDGSVLDGQHRLLAIAQAGLPPDGQPVQVRVTYNVDPDVFAAINTGLARSAADALAMHGGGTGTAANNLAAASALKLLTCYEDLVNDREGARSWLSWENNRLTNDQLVAASRGYPHLMSHLRHAHNMAKPSKLITASVAAFRQIAHTAWPEGLERLDEFCVDLRPDMQERILKHGNPALTLRNWTAKTPPRQIPHRRETLLLLLLRHWNAYAAGREIRAVKVSPTDTMPVAYTPRKARKTTVA